VKKYESHGQCFFWGADFLKRDKTKKRKEKGRCKRYKGGFFLEKMGPSGLMMREKINPNSPYLENRFPQIAKLYRRNPKFIYFPL
jgi:hypothetical protein